MYWKVTSHEDDEFDYWVGPATTDEHHRVALEYAKDRLEELWDQLAEGRKCMVEMELCEGEIPEEVSDVLED